MLVHQAGSVRVGEVVRYTLTYTPAADPILPAPSELRVTVKNTSAVPLRAAYLHGPYTLYAACYPVTFDPDTKYDRQNVDGMPHFEPYLKAGGSWDAAITVPQHLRRMPQGPTASEAESEGSVTWVIEIISQVVFSDSAVVHFELLVSRDGKSTDLLPRRLSASGLPPPAQLHDHWSSESRGYQVPATRGVYSNAITLVIDDTASLWNTPSFPAFEQKPEAAKNDPKRISSALNPTTERSEETNTSPPASDQPKKRNIHLVLLTHGLHSNLGADMLYLKESIDRAARSANEVAMQDRSQSRGQYDRDTERGDDEDSDDREQVIVRGFPGNAARTERGIQYLGKRLAKYILLMTYPDQPYLPLKHPKARNSPERVDALKEAHGVSTCADETDHLLRAYKITSISFIGHSLGGLIQTYAIAYIHKYSPQFFELIRPINFIALATPFLGLSNENPVYVRFALDLGLVGRTGQDLGLSWTAPKVRSGLGGIIGRKNEDLGKPQGQSEPGSKPLLRILPCGAAHEVLHKFQRRTLYSNVVNDGIVPLRTSSLLFLDWKGLDRVQKASRGNGLVGTMAEWGWAELTGASSKALRTSCPAPEASSGDDDDESDNVGKIAPGEAVPEPVGSISAVDKETTPAPGQFLKQPHQTGLDHMAESTSKVTPAQSSPGPFSNFLSIFKPKDARNSKQTRIYKQSQTLTDQSGFLEEPSSARQHLPGTFTSHEDGVNTPPKTTFFESASDILMPPIPPTEFILNPAARPRTIFHDRMYHPDDIPPPKPIKRRTMAGSSPPVEGSKPERRPSSESHETINGTEGGGLKVEEKIARAYHRDLSWRKVLVRLEPDAHNNIIVRRMFTNAYGWPVVKHLVDTHFGHASATQSDDATETMVEKADSLNIGMVKSPGEMMDQTIPEEAPRPHAPSYETTAYQAGAYVGQ